MERSSASSASSLSFLILSSLGFGSCIALERAVAASCASAAGASSASLTIRSVSTTWTIELATDEGRMTGLPSLSEPTRGVVTTRTRKVPFLSHGMSICLRSPANRSANQRSDAPTAVTRAETGSISRAMRLAWALDSRSARVSPLASRRSLPALAVSFQRFLKSSLNALSAASRPVTSVPLPFLERARSSIFWS